MVADSETPSHCDWADYAKGLGIVLVVVGHVIYSLLDANVQVPAAMRGLMVWIYRFHMPLFFIISGMFAAQSIGKGTRRFVLNRAKNLLYPYVLWGSIQGMLHIRFSGYTNARMTWSQLLAMWYNPPGEFWFLYVLLLCQLIFLAAHKTGMRPAFLVLLAQVFSYLGKQSI